MCSENFPRIHKVEIPLALHEQSLTSLTTKVEAAQTDAKEIERRLTTQMSEVKVAADSSMQGVLEKLREVENSNKTKMEGFAESQKQKMEEITKANKVKKKVSFAGGENFL